MKAGKENKNALTEVSGEVVVKKFGKGSKSEHDAVYLETSGASYVLRKMGGNPFNDPGLQPFVGKQVKATGIVEDYIFFAKEIIIIS